MIGQFLQELIQARGSDKQRVLRRYKDDSGIRDILLWTYNPDIVYGIKCAPASPLNVFQREATLQPEEYEVLHRLADKSLSGDAARTAVDSVCRNHGSLLKLVINRDLQAGVAAKTINKVIPGLIPQFNVQLAKEADIHKIDYPCWAQMKYDGVRIVALIRDHGVKFRTRNGKYVNLPRLAEHILKSPINQMVLDGELVYADGKLAGRTSVSGMVNSAMHGGAINESNLTFRVFDHLPYDDFVSGVCKDPYKDRLECVRIICNLIGGPVYAAETQTVFTPEEVNRMADVMYGQGYEGLILKWPHHKYNYKRSKEWVKIKQVKTVELRVLEAEEGKGKYEGQIGALVCEGKVEGRKIRVHVGSGLSDVERSMPMDYFDGNLVEVKYNSIIQDSKTGKWSLFLPRYVCLRLDK